ncbi:MAG: FecR family protein [Niastella sp.]|uniref:FecR family protein n=1 Tax=Niastella sp. TaxID=1869183 RepID=UPI003899EA5D
MKLELYKKMLRGQASSEEIRQVMQWMEEDGTFFDQAMLEEIRQATQQPMPAGIKQQMLTYFEQHGIKEEPRQGLVVPLQTKKGFPRLYRWMAAAVIAGAIIIAGWVFYKPAGKTVPAIAWREVSNKSGNLLRVTLPDSSVIWLRSYAVLHYQENFTRHQERMVDLKGEAYFRIAHDSIHPFIVRTENMTTTVLGTEFNVEAYENEPTIKVSLQRGKVRIGSRENGNGKAQTPQYLSPGQMATFNKNSEDITIREFRVPDSRVWIENGLVLNDVPLLTALHRIERQYNQVIQFDSVKMSGYKHVTACYKQMTMPQILSQLGFVCNFSARKIRNNTYLLETR